MIWPWLIAISMTTIANGQIFCSPVTAIGIDFARQLAPVPIEGPSVPDAAFHERCISEAGSTEYCEQLAGYPNMHGSCLAYSNCISSCEKYLDSFYAGFARTYKDCIQGCPITLSSFCDAFTDYRALRNLVLPYAPTAVVDYTLRVESADYSSRKSATTTSWFSMRFNAVAVCNTTDMAWCSHPMFTLPSSFFSADFAIATDTFIVANERQFPHIQFRLNKLTSRLLRIGSSSTRAGNAAFWTHGCTPPVLTLRVQYALSKQRALGYTVVGDSKGDVACYNRTLYIIEAGEEQKPYTCRFKYTLDELRRKLELPVNGATYELRRLAALQWMQGEIFSYSADGMRQMQFSTSQINNIFDCVDPPSSTIGGMWTTPDSSEPGGCVPCTVKPGSSHMKTRHCNRTVDGLEDCCYSCTAGYLMTASKRCILECKRNSGFDKELGRCTACPRGQFAAGGADTCKTCAARGVPNARTDITLGCVPCTPRSLAVLDQCIPCPINQIVQHSVCAPCPDNSFLGSTSCQTCGAGTFLNAAASACRTCPVHTVAPSAGATTCQMCRNGFSSMANRTLCLQCPSIASLPLSRFFQPGCALQCSALAYLNTTPYVLGGCASCAAIALPKGTCAVSSDCSQPQPCTNAPVRGAVYTGAAPLGDCVCPFACLPGYSGLRCSPCTYPPAFNAALHVATNECVYDCAPGRFRDAAKACTTLCVQLVDEVAAGRIRGRASDYQLSQARPHYILGVCGSTATFPTAAIPFLRRGWWALLGDYTTSECGNALLEKGEGCDDGNVLGGDGCSSTCQVETSQYWDCDLIGTPCLRNCGWVLQTADSWGVSLRGWLLPACPGGVCNCAALSYYNVTQGGKNRRVWMAANLVACNCGGNLQRILPYQDCTLANRGCRQCNVGEYHDDMRGQCAVCGFDCLGGYHRNPQQPDAACRSSFSTSANLGIAETQQQANIGCVRCPTTVGAVRYIDTSCRFVCYKDSTGESTSNDTYCSVAVSADGGCNGACIACRESLGSMLAAYDAFVAIGRTSYNGFFIDRCRDVIGHKWQPCDLASKPSWASWSSASPTVGASTACSWECPLSVTYSYHKTCLPCAASPACGPGERRQVCNTGGSLKACVPCEGATPFPWQVWTSTSDICVPDCDVGVSWSVNPQGQCELCTPLVCALGELLKRCTARADALCQPCSVTYGALAAKQEYITPGLCTARCVSGYYMFSGVCMPCIPVGGPCDVGQNQSSDCVDPAARRAAPLCQLCPFVLAPGEIWGPSCRVVCGLGLVRVNGSCIRCSIALCGLGQSGTCGDYLDCVPCPVVPHEIFTVAGSCVQRSCQDGFARDDYRQCVPVVAEPIITTPVPDDANAIAALIYPARANTHSAMRP